MLMHEELTSQICAAAIEVHRELEPGLLESAYKLAMCRELSLRGLAFVRELPLPVKYKGVSLDCGYRIDILVEDTVILELKAIESILPVHEAQLITYLKLSGKHVGFILNFHSAMMKDGIMRRIL